MEAKIRKIGNSLGVILPSQLINDLHLKSGDLLTIEREGSIIQLKSNDKGFEDWAEAYREANKDYKDVLRELAK